MREISYFCSYILLKQFADAKLYFGEIHAFGYNFASNQPRILFGWRVEVDKCLCKIYEEVCYFNLLIEIRYEKLPVHRLRYHGMPLCGWLGMFWRRYSIMRFCTILYDCFSSDSSFTQNIRWNKYLVSRLTSKIQIFKFFVSYMCSYMRQNLRNHTLGREELKLTFWFVFKYWMTNLMVGEASSSKVQCNIEILKVEKWKNSIFREKVSQVRI